MAHQRTLFIRISVFSVVEVRCLRSSSMLLKESAHSSKASSKSLCSDSMKIGSSTLNECLYFTFSQNQGVCTKVVPFVRPEGHGETCTTAGIPVSIVRLEIVQ